MKRHQRIVLTGPRVGKVPLDTLWEKLIKRDWWPLTLSPSLWHSPDMTNKHHIHFVVIDAHNGRPLRDAKPEEVQTYLKGQTHPYYREGSDAFAHAVRLNAEETVDTEVVFSQPYFNQPYMD